MTKRLPGCHALSSALSTADTLPNCQWPKEGLLLARLGFCRVRLLWACSFSRLKCATSLAVYKNKILLLFKTN